MEQKQSKEQEIMDLKTVTIFGFKLLIILNISRNKNLLFIAPLIFKLIHLIPIIVTLNFVAVDHTPVALLLDPPELRFEKLESNK